MNISNYYKVTKPGIVYANLLTSIAAFIFAARGSINFYLFALCMFGMTMIVAAGCILNNFIDVDIDALMKRTVNRPTARGLITEKNLLIYAFSLCFFGVMSLLLININVLFLALLGLFIYVVIYSAWLKRHSATLSTFVGAISGAMPILVGYCAVKNFDVVGLLLFLILFVWQIPHTYALHIMYSDDYKKVAVPTFYDKYGIFLTNAIVIAFTLVFYCLTQLLWFYGNLGLTYAIIMHIGAISWIAISVVGFYTNNIIYWARWLFFASIIILLLFAVLISFDYMNVII